MSSNEDYIEKGGPADNLTGDLLWLAKRMGVKYSPIPPSTKTEFGMIRRFCSNHPQLTRTSIQQLCKLFKAQANGVDIFPKLPTVINPAIKRWTINQAIALLKMQAGTSHKEFFQKLNQEKTNLPPPRTPVT